MYIGAYELESPFINAGGVASTIEGVRKLAPTGLGAILISTTLEKSIGNSPNGETVYYHDPETRITYNARGLPNKGVRNLVADAELTEMIDYAHYHHKPLILNFAPVTDDPELEIDEAFSLLVEAGIEELDGFELNASCPNVVLPDGGRHDILSHDPPKLQASLERINEIANNYLYIGSRLVRIAPLLDRTNLVNLGMAFKRTDIDAVSAFGTFPGGRPLDNRGKEILQVPGGTGGMSGPGMQHEAELQTMWLNDVRRDQAGRYDIIGSNGIHDAESVRRRLRLGASVVSGTTLFYESLSWPNMVNGLLNDLVELES